MGQTFIDQEIHFLLQESDVEDVKQVITRV